MYRFQLSYYSHPFQDTVRGDDVRFNLFDWERWEGTILAEVAQYVLDWAERALVMAEFSRGDYSYSLECILVLLGRRVRGFIIRRVFKVNIFKISFETFSTFKVKFRYNLNYFSI